MMTFGVDIDGTLCNLRRDLQYEHCQPITAHIDIVNHLFDKGNRVILYTGRGEDKRQKTVLWLKENNVNYHELVMGKPVADVYIDDLSVTPEDFFNPPQETTMKTWGDEVWMVNNEKYCGKILNLNKDHRCSLHYHKIKDETFFVLNGCVLLEIDGEKKILHKNESAHIKPYVIHRFTGLEDSRIIEISTQHFNSDSYRLEGSGKV